MQAGDKVRVLVLPTDGPIHEEWITYEGSSGGTVAGLQGLIGGLFDCMSVADGFDLWVADEWTGLEVNLNASVLMARPVFGVAVLAGTDGEGETISVGSEADRLIGKQQELKNLIGMLCSAIALESTMRQVMALPPEAAAEVMSRPIGAAFGMDVGPAPKSMTAMATDGRYL